MLAQWLDYRLDIIGFLMMGGATEFFFSSKSCRLVLIPTQFPIQWVPWIFPWSNVAGHDVDHSLHIVPRLRMSGAILPLPQYVFMAWAGTTALLFHLLIFIERSNEIFCNFTHMTATPLHHRCTVWWNNFVFPPWMYSGFPRTTWIWQTFNH